MSSHPAASAANGMIMSHETSNPECESESNSLAMSNSNVIMRSVSPPDSSTHSSSCINRVSLIQLAAEQKAIRIKLFRNGDKLFKGVMYSLLTTRIRNMNSLFEDLNRLFANQPSLPKGVQVVFTIDGSSKVKNLESFIAGSSYVVSSSDTFIKLDYLSLNKPDFYTCGGNRNRNIVPILKSKSNSAFNSPRARRSSKTTTPTTASKPSSAHCRSTAASNRVNAISNTCNGSSPVNGNHNDSSKKEGDQKMTKKKKQKKQTSDELIDSNQNKSDSKSNSKTITINNNNNHESSSASVNLLFPRQIVSKYDILGIIGDGNFAIVHECVLRSSGESFALKIIDKKKCKGKEAMIENEVSILRRIKHSNIVPLIEDVDFGNELYLVMEFMAGGDLFDAIATASKFSEKEASSLMNNLASALVYLHKLNICHRDIKPENLLLCYDHNHTSGNHVTGNSHSGNSHSSDTRTRKRILKLGDFGLAVFLSPGHKLHTVCGTPNYVAPEILAETGYDHSVDIWASGVIAYVLLCGYPPFVSPENDQDELFDQILTGRYEFTAPYWDNVSKSATELISQMLQVDPPERLTASQVLEHPWIKNNGGTTTRDHGRKKSSNALHNVTFDPTTTINKNGDIVLPAHLPEPANA